MMFSRRGIAILTAIALLGSVAGVFGYNDLRFWATSSEIQEIAGVSIQTASELKKIAEISLKTVSKLEEIAGVSLTTAIAQRADFLALERRELRLCQSSGQNCTGIQRRIRALEREIKDLEAKRRKYGG